MAEADDGEPLALTTTERQALIWPLKHTLDNDRYPLSPRLAPLKAILAKLEPPQPRPELPRPLKAAMAPSRANRRRRRG